MLHLIAPALALLLAPGAPTTAPLELPILIRVARCGGKPVRSQSWLQEHLAGAGRIFGEHGIRLRPRLESFTPASCVALDAAARHALASHVPARGVTVLVMERVRDLALPSYDLMGVHWRYRGGDRRLAGRRYLLLTARARPPVLAHELGHYFGLPHDPAGGNLMTPGPSAPIWRQPGKKPRPFAPRLTPAQARQLRARLLEQQEPAAASPARP